MRWTSPRTIPLACAISLALGADPAIAATITVTTGGDSGTASTCTLRQAITAANNDAAGVSSCGAGSGADTIQFAGNLVNATVTLAGSQLAVTQPLTISGSGQTIDANHASRVLYANATTLIASNLTLSGGTTTGTGPDAAGAGIDGYNADVTLTSVHITGNSAATSGAGAYGFGGSLTLSNSTVSNNSSAYGGGVSFYSGALSVSNSVISNNTGGGIRVGFGAYANTVSIYRSTISNNDANCSAYFCAGGLYVANGAATIVDSTISGNTAPGGGFHYVAGGAYFVSIAAMLINSTITGNTASADEFVAGGLSESHYMGTGFGLTLVNCTVASNSATKTSVGGTSVAGGVLIGQFPGEYGALTLANTILAANTPASSDLITGGANSTVGATFSLLGTALNTSPYNAGANKNVFSDAPGLGPLQDNGGATQTRALLAASPAIDKGSNALAQQNGTPLVYDQRGPGHKRVFGTAVDIGAFEYSADVIFAGSFEAGP